MCASPGVVLAAKGLLHGLAATAHPGFVKNLPDAASANARVVVDGDVITSRGPGTAIEFALALVEKLYGAAKAQEVAGPMVLPSVSHGNRVPNEWRLDDAAVLEN
jgi:4-methyl-5(b-hydroxyethyl)-thiazole monophosphate biosynthesis